jgi:hypothetical protein
MRLVLAICFLMLSGAAQAITITQKGDAAYLSGAIKPGAYVTLREFLAEPRSTKLRVLYLTSTGGKVEDATLMARDIRRAGLITAVDGTKPCRSACTMLFAAGISRHYFNHAKVKDELIDKYQGRAGLGYHQAHGSGISGKERNYSGRGTHNLINVYYEHGSPAAADFATKAGQNQMYFVSGPTALAHGLATSLSPP